jgi:hypothetical protein
MEPIKIKVGGVYRTRYKSIVVICDEDEDARDYPFVGMEIGCRDPLWYDRHGYYDCPEAPENLDLVEYLGNITDQHAVKALTSTPDAK